jgi:hypothetical protein
MIEVFLLFCFVAILSATVSVVRGIATVLGIVTRPIRERLRRLFPSALPREHIG